MPQVSATSATPPPAAAASDTPIPPDTHLRDGGHTTLRGETERRRANR